MSKTCKDFGEVLVALGQGKIVVDKEGYLVRLQGETFQYSNRLAYRDDDEALGVGFSYPAPIYEEPKTVEIDVWLNVYDWGVEDLVYLSREKADEHTDGLGAQRIACSNIKRTVTEGEGL